MLLITGAAGFIGSQIVQGLNKQGVKDLILVDELKSDCRWNHLVNLRYQDYFEKDDWLSEMTKKTNLGEQISACIHLGACSSTTETDASFLVKNNFEYSKILAKWCLNHNICFIYASSAATYGNGALGYNDEKSILELSPLNMYGYSKQMFDQWLYYQDYFGKKTGIYGLKYFNVYGPGESHKNDMKSMVAKAYQQIKQEKKVSLFKSYHPSYEHGQQERDFIFIEDVVEMTLFFLKSTQASGIYNVGTGVARSWVNMMQATFKSMSVSCQIEFIEMPKSMRLNYQYFTQATIHKIKKSGFDTSKIHSLEQGIHKYIEYLTKNDLFF